MDRPDWCEDETCTPAYCISTKGGGQCVGKLAVPTSHISEGVNTMSRCHYDTIPGSVSTFHINYEDIIIDVYLAGEALRMLGLALPGATIDNLPRKDG